MSLRPTSCLTDRKLGFPLERRQTSQQYVEANGFPTGWNGSPSRLRPSATGEGPVSGVRWSSSSSCEKVFWLCPSAAATWLAPECSEPQRSAGSPWRSSQMSLSSGGTLSMLSISSRAPASSWALGLYAPSDCRFFLAVSSMKARPMVTMSTQRHSRGAATTSQGTTCLWACFCRGQMERRVRKTSAWY